MNSALLGSLVEIKGGGTPRRDLPEYWGGSIPWATVKDFVTTEIDSTQESVTELGVSKSATNIIPAGNIIVPTRMALGKMAINLVDVAINQDLKALILIDPQTINRNFLFRFLLSKARYIESRGKGATVKGIRLDVLKELEIPIPPVAEQKRIAAILDKADAIRRKRRQAIQLADEFLRSVFLEMFGDPVLNPKNWDQKQIESTIENIKPGWSIKGNNRDRMPGEWGVLKVSAVTSGRFLPKECKVVAIKNLKREMVKPRKGDLLFSRANTRELVAATCLVMRDHNHLFLSDKIWKIIPKQNVLRPEFLKFVLSHPRYRDKIREQATGTSGSMLNVSQVKVKQLIIPVPPLAFQEKFSEILWKIYEIRNQVDESIKNATALLNSITQRAFRGGL